MASASVRHLGLSLLCLAPLVALGEAAPPAAQPGAWDQIYSVLTHPRCINCHTSTDYPRQGDDRHIHLFGVVRGPDGRGVPGATCAACHQSTNNDASGIPGAPNWHLAPPGMSWESRPGVPMTKGALCLMLKDPKRNGQRDLAALLEHNEHERLVLWAWHPGVHPNGEARDPPPISHDDFVKVFQQWVTTDGPCPQP
jgi:mono/diheme cytochrome c family protein